MCKKVMKVFEIVPNQKEYKIRHNFEQDKQGRSEKSKQSQFRVQLFINSNAA